MQLGNGHRQAGWQKTMDLRRILILCSLASWATGYKQGDNVTLYVNKVGPYHNPQETYHYYTLPVCRPEKVSVGSVCRCVRGLPTQEQRRLLCPLNVTAMSCARPNISVVLHGYSRCPVFGIKENNGLYL